MDLPRGLLFDLDDTIIAFSPSAEPCWREACERHAPRLPGVDPAALFEQIRAAAEAFWRDPVRDDRGRLDLVWARRSIVSSAVQELGADSPPVAEELADDYARMREESVELFPGARDALLALRAAGIPLGLVTNGSSEGQRAKLERFRLEALFDSVHIEGEHGAGKPDASIFHAALSGIGVSAAEAWMVGDNLARDIAGAQGIGVHGVWCDWAGKGLPDDSPVRPDRIVCGVHELLPR